MYILSNKLSNNIEWYSKVTTNFDNFASHGKSFFSLYIIQNTALYIDHLSFFCRSFIFCYVEILWTLWYISRKICFLVWEDCIDFSKENKKLLLCNPSHYFQLLVHTAHQWLSSFVEEVRLSNWMVSGPCVHSIGLIHYIFHLPQFQWLSNQEDESLWNW